MDVKHAASYVAAQKFSGISVCVLSGWTTWAASQLWCVGGVKSARNIRHVEVAGWLGQHPRP